MLTITTKSNLPEELEIVHILNSLEEKYSLPIFTENICIEKGAIPHSHPLLTLNTRTVDPLTILKTFIHEQFHWFATQHPHYIGCIQYLKRKYVDNGECNKSGTYPNSFWEHIIVCFNTWNYLKNILSEDAVIDIYSKWQAYPKTEQLVVEKYKEIYEDLMKFNVVFNQNNLSKIK